jgi:hypothetical protein
MIYPNLLNMNVWIEPAPGKSSLRETFDITRGVERHIVPQYIIG